MTASSRAPAAKSKRAAKVHNGKQKPAGAKRSRKSETDVAIANELAPAVALALLEKTEQSPGGASPALDVLAAAAAPSETTGKVRVELLFESGSVLPVEMSDAAGAALSKKLAEKTPKK
jgi:hypothetical protein